MRALRTDIGGRNEEIPWQVTLDVQVPLLHIASRMISAIGERRILHYLRRVLLRPQSAKCAADRWNDAWKERGIDGVDRYGAVNRPVVGSGRVVHQIVVGVQAEGNIVRDEKDSVASANNGFLIKAVRKTHAGRNVGPVEGNRGSARRHQKNIPSCARQTRNVGESRG